MKNSSVVKEARKAAIKQLEFYNKMMSEKIANESVSEQYIREKVAADMQPFYDVFDKPKEKKMTKPKKKLFIVDTITSFRNRYVIEADELEHAYDEVTMVESGDSLDSFEPAEQRYLGETILDGREITIEDFDNMIVNMEETGEGSHWLGRKLIRKIDYNNTPVYKHEDDDWTGV